jgi:hypothetical protein
MVAFFWVGSLMGSWWTAAREALPESKMMDSERD